MLGLEPGFSEKAGGAVKHYLISSEPLYVGLLLHLLLLRVPWSISLMPFQAFPCYGVPYHRNNLVLAIAGTSRMHSDHMIM